MADRFIEEGSILEYSCESLTIRLEREVIDIRAIDEYLPRARLIETHEKLDDGRLPTSCMSHKCYAFSFLYLKVNTGEHFTVGRRIGEGYILESDRFFYFF